MFPQPKSLVTQVTGFSQVPAPVYNLFPPPDVPILKPSKTSATEFSNSYESFISISLIDLELDRLILDSLKLKSLHIRIKDPNRPQANLVLRRQV